jgi:ring-1,2-phenylacetyl-CoA epoxidase subunit PaaD
MVTEMQKRRNAEMQKGAGGADCRLSNVDCRMEESDQTIDNRQSQIANFDWSAVWKALESVADPEIPVVNVVEMGMIADVRREADCVVIDMTPTFVGCPALDVIRENIRIAVSAVTPAHVTVNVVFDPPWTSDRISASGREKLKAFGLAPPGERCSGGSVQTLERTPCPYCNSLDTDLESLFGPTLCRSIHYCRSCLQSFEHFKEV